MFNSVTDTSDLSKPLLNRAENPEALGSGRSSFGLTDTSILIDRRNG